MQKNQERMDVRGEIIACLMNDAWRMDIVRTVRDLLLPDCWVCAGFVRSCVWDARHGYRHRSPLEDVDVVYYDPQRPGQEEELRWESVLREQRPDVPWSVKNEARMHLRNGDAPYSSTEDAISRFPEIPTSVAVRLVGDRLELIAPWGVDDLWNLIVRPIPSILEKPDKLAIYRDRINKKDWASRWPLLTITGL